MWCCLCHEMQLEINGTNMSLRCITFASVRLVVSCKFESMVSGELSKD
jgi:hypothetical protein